MGDADDLLSRILETEKRTVKGLPRQYVAAIIRHKSSGSLGPISSSSKAFGLFPNHDDPRPYCVAVAGNCTPAR